GCRSYAPVDERKPDGSFAPGDLARCVHCKSVSKAPALGPASLHKGEDEPVATMHVSDTEVLFSKGWTGKGLMGFRSSPLYASPAPLPVGVTDAAEARIKALEEALRPFAFEGLHTDIERFDDETHIEVHFPRTNPRKATPVSWVYVEDVLRARATLNSGEKADG
ncbi:MAG: hypothetical protein RLW68_06860, partial [Devosia marina]|uniref:hypothetical protein n=1 Tax=Devosia marina TaxID=2683198 RepID=UPI0032ECA5E0